MQFNQNFVIFYLIYLDGSVEQQPVIKFSVEEEVFDFENLYTELCKAVKECKPDVEVHSGVKMNSSIRCVKIFIDGKLALLI